MAKIQIQSASSVAGKETIYVDVDDEITAIIDKVASAKGKIVALVLPKRSVVLQSIVNMKLLKRTADTADKNLVLITTEAGLMPLAGAVGLHVASTPTGKPSIPPAPAATDDGPEDIDEPLNIVDGTAGDDFDARAVGDTSIGELAGKPAAADTADEPIDMAIEGAAAATAARVVKPKKNRKLRVPNFDSFRKKTVLAVVVVVLLVVAGIFAVVVLPKATIAIKTDSSTIPTNLNLSLDTAAKQLDETTNTVPATLQSQQKTGSQQAPATGQQNNGQKASGSVTLSVRKCSGSGTPQPLPTGSSVTSGGKTYILQDKVVFSHVDASDYPCVTFAGDETDIIALKGGAEYNTDDDATFTAANGAKGTGSADGGTDVIVKIVTQSDIDGAASKMTAADTDKVKQQLVAGLQSKGLLAVPATFLAGDPKVTTSAKAGDAADTVTVTTVTTYTMLGVQKADIKKLVTKNVNDQIDKGKQVILDDGVANAKFSATAPATTMGANVSMQVKSRAGPQLDTDSLKTQLAGKKRGDIVTQLKRIPGVTDVEVRYSPFWVHTVPDKTSKVTITIDKESQ